jgi:opacity protein-like surface antigen
MTQRIRRTAVAAALALALAPAAFAQETKPAASSGAVHRFVVGFDYSNGDYGGSSDTSILSIPFAYRLTTGPWQFGATIPWLIQDGPGNVNRDIGQFGPAGVSRSESGPGDLLLSALRSLNIGSPDYGIDVGARIKLPTASSSKGLGTGEPDFHFLADLYATSGRLQPYGTVGYKFLGDPSGFDLDDVFWLDLGATYRLSETRSAGLMWHTQQRASSFSGAQNDLTAYYVMQLDSQWRAQVYGLVGFSSGSPDYAGGAFFSRSF